DERDLLSWNPRALKSLDHIALDAPRHGTNEAFRRGRRICGADFQDLRDQCRIVGNPVPHNDPTPGSGHSHQLLRHIEWFRREHRSEDAHHKVKAPIFKLMQIGRIAFLELTICEALGLCTLVASIDKVPCYVHPEHVRSESRRRQRCRPVATSDIQNFETFSDAESFDESLSAFPHSLSNAGKIAFFPKCFV